MEQRSIINLLLHANVFIVAIWCCRRVQIAVAFIVIVVLTTATATATATIQKPSFFIANPVQKFYLIKNVGFPP